MYHPTSRVLTVLELLQSRPSITGPELAARLEMDVRTVRRYIAHLQDVGIPIEANVGRLGGYRLRPGFKLPPLLFSEEEATAIMLGLLGTSWLEIGQSSVAVEGALAKVSRVLPAQARERLQAMATHLHFFSAGQQAQPDVSLLLRLSEAIGQSQRMFMEYRSLDDELTQRKIDPYGVVARDGRWYLVAYCHLRRDYRTFRLDRIQQAQPLDEAFTRDERFDYRGFVTARQPRSGAHIEVEFQASLFAVQQRIPATYGQLTETPVGVLIRSQYDDMDDMARYLVAINLPFIIHHPPELRAAVRRLGERMIQMAKAKSPASTHRRGSRLETTHQPTS